MECEQEGETDCALRRVPGRPRAVSHGRGIVRDQDAGVTLCVERMSSLERVLRSPALRTGVGPVDRFAARERRSLNGAPVTRARQYVNALRRHVNTMCEFTNSKHGTFTLSIPRLNMMHRYIFHTQ